MERQGALAGVYPVVLYTEQSVTMTVYVPYMATCDVLETPPRIRKLERPAIEDDTADPVARRDRFGSMEPLDSSSCRGEDFKRVAKGVQRGVLGRVLHQL